GMVLLVASFTFGGHSSKDALRWLLSLALLAHLSVVAFWYGGGVPLFLGSSPQPPPPAGEGVAPVSPPPVLLVAPPLLLGLLLATLLLPNLAALLRPYGELLTAKVVGFCALMPLAALNRWRFGPALQRGDLAAGRRFRQVVVAEFALLATILCVTAVMTTF